MTNGYAPGNSSPEQDARLELRISHADRDRVVETLTAAAGEGLLAADELDDRVEAALSARTRGELAVLTADLPPSGIERQAKDLIRIDQRFGDVTRAGQWVVPRRMEIKLTAGDVTLDFTRALIIRDVVRIEVDLGLGGDLTLVIRPGIVVDTDGLTGRLGDVKVPPAEDPRVPVILRVELVGRVRGGGVVARFPRRTFSRGCYANPGHTSRSVKRRQRIRPGPWRRKSDWPFDAVSVDLEQDRDAVPGPAGLGPDLQLRSARATSDDSELRRLFVRAK